MSKRTASIERTTNETSITLKLGLDPEGGPTYRHATGVGFFDHMLDHIAKHGRFDLDIEARGDTHVDDHHTVEDVGIVLGQAIGQALGDRVGIERYGFASVPMDEVLARVTLDLSGRFALVCDDRFSSPDAKIGTFDVQLVREFMGAVAQAGRFNLHIEVPHAGNDHHVAEAIFKAFGRALHAATRITRTDMPSTKGSL
ncbi:imidazoleglycerol-phosphate dehydratase HisB [Mucisphaera calidilacus]|uniref:Imidazoleglycerol-phosphate dehydratase n=1 Tax=Mucisphaera calidilacus TaxID=2527982 RepID=A0A518BXI3_9BACT|nr:imidazoleglycerol-phosphate dehydratase HisB [Mucisphaera calidilacus]QDU71664.1 Imidazoleglycerol-phosphate dehydratase [Mucisphaera calidilacus]